MKKYISLFLCLTCILTLVACGKKAAPIQLPQTSDITIRGKPGGKVGVFFIGQPGLDYMAAVGRVVSFHNR